MTKSLGVWCLLVGGCCGEARAPITTHNSSPWLADRDDAGAPHADTRPLNGSSSDPSTAVGVEAGPPEVVHVPSGSLCNVKLTGCSAIVAIEQSAVRGFARLRCPTTKSTDLELYPAGMTCYLQGDAVNCYWDRLPPAELTTWKQLQPWYGTEANAIRKMWSACATWGGSGYWTPAMPVAGGAECALDVPMTAFDLPPPPSDALRLRVMCRAAVPPVGPKKTP